MNKSVVKKSLKVAGAFAAATGVVALSALVASGAAVGAVAEGFKEAGKVVKKSLEKSEQEKKTADAQDFVENGMTDVDAKTVEVPMTEELVKSEETMETQSELAEEQPVSENA